MEWLNVRRIWLTVVPAVAVTLVVVFLAIMGFRAAAGFLVEGVPYSGIRGVDYQQFLFTGDNGRIRGVGLGSPGAALLMVAGYWYLRDRSQQLIFPRDTLGHLPAFNAAEYSLEDIARVAEEYGYRAKIRPAPLGVWTFVLYNSPGKKTPIIVEQDLTAKYPGKGKVFRVVVGASPWMSKVTVHDYVYGPTQEMDGAEFESLWRKPKRLLVIEPKDRDAADSAPPQFSYQSAGKPDESFIALRTAWYLAEEARDLGNRTEAMKYWESIVHHPQFSSNPLERQRYHYHSLLSLYLQEKEYQKVVELERQVVEANRPLGQLKENPSLWLVLGEAYLGLGNKAKAAEYAQRALSAGGGQPAQALLERSQ